ncbi:MAG: hypothetical protein IT458_18065 [Planctomycetes bacterium]|nr:hypothetical protein [Planctomycetota bacterium]
MVLRPTAATLASACLLIAGASAQDSAPTRVDFATQIRPIFAERCLSCHGPKEQEADLRLDRRATVFPKEPAKWLVVPGKPEKSALYQRIVLPADDPDVMPAEGDPLTKEQIERIRLWIVQGAEWPADETAGAAAAPTSRPAAPAPEAPRLVLDAEARKARDAAIAALKARGAHAARLAEDRDEAEVNLAVLGAQADDALLAELAPLAPCLVWLNAARTRVSDAGLARLSGMPQLRHLDLSGTAVGDAGVRALGTLPALETLNLFGTRVGDGALDPLAAFPALRRVYLWQSGVTPTAAKALRARRPDLRVDLGEYAVLPAPPPPARPVNTECPVSGKPVDVAVTLNHDGKVIAFCCTKCQAAFAKEPQRYLSALK